MDSNVLLDVLTDDPQWFDWSSAALAEAAAAGTLVINPIIYAELAPAFERIEELNTAVTDDYEREPLPWEAAFLAGKVFVRYRRRGGRKRSPLPDFYIGAHAAVRRYRLLTRDPKRYTTYFPTLALIAP